MTERTTRLDVGVVDVLVVAPSADGDWDVLLLRRAEGVRCAGAWEVVHGSVEPGERPAEAARRELLEETGLRADRWYNVMTHAFYLHRPDVVEVAVVCCAFVDRHAPLTLGPEHAEARWLPRAVARREVAWPSERVALDRAWDLLQRGDAGPLEDVLRIA